jgi:hypothetical protein
MRLFFYNGYSSTATWKDRVIAFFSFGKYSHVELEIQKELFFSSNPEKGLEVFSSHGFIKYPEHWYVVDLGDMGNKLVLEQARRLIGRKYDLLGALLSVFKLRRNPSETKLYCSEAVVMALDAKGRASPFFDMKSWRTTPNSLFRRLIKKGYKVQHFKKQNREVWYNGSYEIKNKDSL